MASSSASLATSTALPPEHVIFGTSTVMLDLQRRLKKVAQANVPVLIEGESGTGKEIIARLLHQFSPWHSGPYVKVNCPAIPGTLMESELFGYERGAFTGAFGTRPGRMEMANLGTLFLDEIGELEMGLQAKLLQVLQDGQFCRIGATEDKRLEARVVCATNRSLSEEIAGGIFRQDLYYRISVVTISLPPLRERRQDIPTLVKYFLQFYNASYSRNAAPLSARAVEALCAFHWPGNVRQLENLIKRYVILGSPEVIMDELGSERQATANGDFFELPADGKISLKLVTKQAVARIERNIILKVLKTHQWNRKKTARALGISYRALLYKLKEGGLHQEADGNISHAE